jgi:hypothetical protein
VQDYHREEYQFLSNCAEVLLLGCSGISCHHIGVNAASKQGPPPGLILGPSSIRSCSSITWFGAFWRSTDASAAASFTNLDQELFK